MLTIAALFMLACAAKVEDCQNGEDDDGDGYVDAADFECDCIPEADCCVTCNDGPACGDGCIGAADECNTDAGCACDADEVCAE